MPLKPHPDAKPCGSCGAAIFFARSRNGAPMPLDAVPVMRVVLQGDDGHAQIVKTYSTHFATCPNAAQHRKEGKTDA